MCKAFSCLIDRSGKVYWKAGIDSHEDLRKHFKLREPKGDTNEEIANNSTFCKVEISPENNDYLRPDKWVFKLDERVEPKWFHRSRKAYEKECFIGFRKWKKEVYSRINIKEALDPIHPFKIKPPKRITKMHFDLLREWASVGDSVWDSVGASVGDSVWASVGDSVWDSVRASVGDSVWDSVWDSVGASVGDSVRAYYGSLFKLDKWKNVKHKRGEYPFKPLVKLWKLGLVPSFDGKVYCIHGGKKAKVMFEISREDLITKSAKDKEGR